MLRVHAGHAPPPVLPPEPDRCPHDRGGFDWVQPDPGQPALMIAVCPCGAMFARDFNLRTRTWVRVRFVPRRAVRRRRR